MSLSIRRKISIKIVESWHLSDCTDNLLRDDESKIDAFLAETEMLIFKQRPTGLGWQRLTLAEARNELCTIPEKEKTMDETIELTRTAFFQLLDQLGFPNPDDIGDPNNPFGPYGPSGPVSIDLGWVMLNPQPLPPYWRQEHLAALRFAGPQPQPWRARVTVLGVIQSAMMQMQLAEAVGGSEGLERSVGVVGSMIHEIVDDWCGTGKPRWPWPKPRPFESDEVSALDLLAAGREFQRLADTLEENPLQNEFAAVADQLFEVGLSRLAE